MKVRASHCRRVIVLGILTATLSYLSTSAEATLRTVAMGTQQRVTNRPANPNGAVFVAEYHHIRSGKNDMFRSADNFRRDLEQFYAMGFRPVLASQYLANRINIPSGALPLVMTFDDAVPSQLQLTPTGQPTPDCAIGIWQDFARRHPDFPVRATFFVLPDSMWGPKRDVKRKIDLLKRLGCELENHTITHPKLKKLTDDKVMEELGKAEDRLASNGQSGPHSLALPYGISPKNANILKGFDWHGNRITFTGVFLVGANPAPSPNSPKFNRYRVPRIMANSGPYGIDFWLKKLSQGQVKPYVQP